MKSPSLTTYTQPDIYKTVTHYTKTYPNNLTKLYEYDKPVRYRLSGFEEINKKINKKLNNNQKQTWVSEQDSIRRSRTKISDLVISNDFDMFFTFTFNCKACQQSCKNKPCICDNKCKRFDPEFCKKRLSKWLANQKEIYGHFHYIIVPEYHKDGKSIHFHGLFKSYKGDLTPTKITQNGRKIYNIKKYKAGHSTAVKIDNIEKVSSYIKKYITKDMPTFKGKKRYWNTKNLQRPKVATNPHITFEEMLKFKETYSFKNLTMYETTEKLESLINYREYIKNARSHTNGGQSSSRTEDIKSRKTIQYASG